MLNDTEKERIRLEEFYRNEIRESISASKGSPLWTFLNSTFGVWLLSALFVSGIGAAYTKYQEKSADRRRTQEATERLDLELGYRFSQIQVHLSQASLVPEPE